MSASALYLLMFGYILLDVTLNVGYENTVKILVSGHPFLQSSTEDFLNDLKEKKK